MSIFNFFKEKSTLIYVVFVIIFAFLINWNYSKYGVYPIDTFLHYDSAYRILNGEYPIRDYWIVSGIFVDFLQAFFFKIFGVNWYAYIFHSSILNAIFAILTFYTLITLGLQKKSAFFYSISFAILAYPVSGTPFVDLHATFFCLVAVYFTFFAIRKPEKKINWFLVVLFYFFAFFCKQVPAAYIIFLNTIIIFPYLLLNKKIKSLKIISYSVLFCLILVFFLFYVLNINIYDFYIQYLDYPQSIGSERFSILKESTLIGFFNTYKFILIPLISLFYIHVREIYKKKTKFNSSQFINFLIFFTFCVGLLLHQLLTKNQIYIYFLIPITFALLQIEIQKLNFKNKNKLIYLLLFLVIFSTIKYHIRFNENRKFHELTNIDISQSIKSEELHHDLAGIHWISPSYIGKPKDEIKLLKRIINDIDNKNNKIMLITHYLFLDSITIKKLNYPSRTTTNDGASIPDFKNKHFNYYKNFLRKKIKKTGIREVYFIKKENLEIKNFTDFFERKCYSKNVDEVFIIYKINQKCLD